MAIYSNVKIALGTAVADEGTVTVAYPAGLAQADFTSANASASGIVVLNGNDIYSEIEGDIGLSYGGSDITLTNDTGATWPAGSQLIVGLARVGGTQELVQSGAIANLAGSLTGSVDGTLADVAAIALDTTNTYTDSAVNTAVNTAITSVNLQLKELQTKVNAILTNLRTSGVIST